MARSTVLVSSSMRPVIEEPAEVATAGQCVADRIGKAAARRDVSHLRLEPGLHCSNQRQRANLSYVPPCVGCLASDRCLDRIELGDAPQRFGRDRRVGGLLHLIELAPCMGPARRELDKQTSVQEMDAYRGEGEFAVPVTEFPDLSSYFPC